MKILNFLPPSVILGPQCPNCLRTYSNGYFRSFEVKLCETKFLKILKFVPPPAPLWSITALTVGFYKLQNFKHDYLRSRKSDLGPFSFLTDVLISALIIYHVNQCFYLQFGLWVCCQFEFKICYLFFLWWRVLNEGVIWDVPISPQGRVMTMHNFLSLHRVMFG